MTLYNNLVRGVRGGGGLEGGGYSIIARVKITRGAEQSNSDWRENRERRAKHTKGEEP